MAVSQTSAHTFDAQESAHEGFAHVHILDLHLNFVFLAVRGLSAYKAAAGS